MGTQTSLGEFVDAFVGRTSPGLDHIQNTTFIGSQTNDFTGNGTAQSDALAGGL